MSTGRTMEVEQYIFLKCRRKIKSTYCDLKKKKSMFFFPPQKFKLQLMQRKYLT